MSRVSRVHLNDVLAAECCHPNCYAPALTDIASHVPLCERHIMVVYREANLMLASHRAMEQAYELLPAEADFIPGPCPSCGNTGLLAHLANGFVVCKSAGCDYERSMVAFCTERKILMGVTAATDHVVYYMRLGNRAKIGTSRNLKARISVIQPEDCMGYEMGDRKLERKRHAQFAHLRVSGEWFMIGSDLVRHVNSLRIA